MRYYIDCEFDGHNGPLLSFAIVRQSLIGEPDSSLYIKTFSDLPKDPWVIQNVWPVMDNHIAQLSTTCIEADVGLYIKCFIGELDPHPIIVADSPVDIARFCRAISTQRGNRWESTNYPRMTFEVHNVNSYPTDLPNACQHNAWWDAMALRHRLESRPK